MNRRQFIRRASGAVAGLIFARFVDGRTRLDDGACYPKLFAQIDDCDNAPFDPDKAQLVSQGKSIWVDWSEDGPGDDANDGLSPDAPLSTVQAAIDKSQSAQVYPDCPTEFRIIIPDCGELVPLYEDKV